MSMVSDLIEQAQALGARLWLEGKCLELDIPADFPDKLLDLIRENKAEVLSYLCHSEEQLSLEIELSKKSGGGKVSLVDNLERMLELGIRLKQGEISAVRCGISGKRCTNCHGVPCLGSEPWFEPEKKE